MREPLLGAEQRDHLALGIDLHPEPARVVGRERFAHLVQAAVGGVVVHVVAGHRLGEGLAQAIGRGLVGIADSERDHVDPAGARARDAARERAREVLGHAVEAVREPHVAARSRSARSVSMTAV